MEKTNFIKMNKTSIKLLIKSAKEFLEQVESSSNLLDRVDELTKTQFESIDDLIDETAFALSLLSVIRTKCFHFKELSLAEDEFRSRTALAANRAHYELDICLLSLKQCKEMIEAIKNIP